MSTPLLIEIDPALDVMTVIESLARAGLTLETRDGRLTLTTPTRTRDFRARERLLEAGLEP